MSDPTNPVEDIKLRAREVIQADNIAASELTAELEEQGVALDQKAWRTFVQAFARHRFSSLSPERDGEMREPTLAAIAKVIHDEVEGVTGPWDDSGGGHYMRAAVRVQALLSKGRGS